MDNKVKKVLKLINQSRYGTPVKLGEVWAKQYTNSGVVFDTRNERVWLLNNGIKGRAEAFSSVVELLSIMKKLESENDVFIVDGRPVEGDVVAFLCGINDFLPGQLPDQFILGEEIILSLTESSCRIISGNHVYNGEIVSSALYAPLLYYFSSEMFIGDGLSRYIKRKYLTEEQYDSIRALRISRWSLVIAILIAIFSPIVNLYVSEKWKQREAESLLRNPEEVPELVNHEDS